MPSSEEHDAVNLKREPGGPGSCVDSKRRSRFIRAIRWLDENVEYYLNFIFYMYLTWIIIIEVFRRYALGSATAWGEETARFAFIWLAYIAAARGVKKRSHLSIEIIREFCGRGVKFVLFMISDVAFFTLAAIIIFSSIKFVHTTILFGQYFTGGLGIPLAFAVAAVPVGWTLIAIRVIQRNILTIMAFRRGEAMTTGSTVEE